jgi:rubrerythrin
MKRLLFVLVSVAILAGVAAAAEKAMAPDVRTTLEKAVANEREAAGRYEAFAVKADGEGYPGAATLFRAQAKAEKIHARRFAQALKSAGVAVPNAAAAKPEVGSSEENLRAAASAELGERDSVYREGVDTCHRNKDEATARLFDQTRDAEAEHANLDSAASRNLDRMKSAKSYYVCGRCGYVTDVRLPICPSCRHSAGLDEVH